jgi:hypothetical protein
VKGDDWRKKWSRQNDKGDDQKRLSRLARSRSKARRQTKMAIEILQTDLCEQNGISAAGSTV